MKTTIPLLGAISLLLISCGSDGKEGAQGLAGARGEAGVPGPKGDKGDPGTTGPAGEAGPAGPRGPAGSNGLSADGGGVGFRFPEGGLTSSCLTPCHGFTGLVEQWKTSTHYATFISNLGGEEVATWTGATACGNCHAIDGISYRVDGTVNHVGTTGPTHLTNGQVNYLASTTNKITESTYAGMATVAVVHCTTCHKVDPTTDPHKTGKPFVPGSFPLQVPTGAADQSYLEKSSAVGVSDGTPAGTYQKGNACIFCHKSRKDVTNYITASNNLSSSFWGPHEGPQSDIYTGKGGYHYGTNTYRQSTHQGFKNGCIDCHMAPVVTNDGIGDHSFAPQLTTCQKSGCHSNATSFDVGGGQSAMEGGIQELRVALNNLGYLTRSAVAPYVALTATDLSDTAFQTDQVLPGTSGVTADFAGALYNYLLLARGSAGGVHNPVYVRELIYDSVKAITGKAPATIPTRP